MEKKNSNNWIAALLLLGAGVTYWWLTKPAGPDQPTNQAPGIAPGEPTPVLNLPPSVPEVLPADRSGLPDGHAGFVPGATADQGGGGGGDVMVKTDIYNEYLMP